MLAISRCNPIANVSAIGKAVFKSNYLIFYCILWNCEAVSGMSSVRFIISGVVALVVPLV